MSRPYITGTRGARYLTPATIPATVAVTRTSRVCVRPVERAYLAACLATGFRSAESDLYHAARKAARRARMAPPSPCVEVAALVALRDAALLTLDRMAATLRQPTRDALVALAVVVQERLAAQPMEHRALLGVALVRTLLDDAPETCVDLDRAVRDAARLHYHAPAPVETLEALLRTIDTARAS